MSDTKAQRRAMETHERRLQGVIDKLNEETKSVGAAYGKTVLTINKAIRALHEAREILGERIDGRA